MPKWIDPDESSSGPSVSLGTLANATKMENSSIHAEFTAVQTYFSVTTCPTDQRITSRGVGRQFSRICLWKQKEGQTSYKEKKKRTAYVCMGSGILSHCAALRSLLMTVLWERRAHLLCLTAGGGSVRACGEQMNRSQEHGWVCEKKGERDLKYWMALCQPLTEQINTISTALGVYAPKTTNFALSYLFQNHSITAAQITASHWEFAVENSLSWESK